MLPLLCTLPAAQLHAQLHSFRTLLRAATRPTACPPVQLPAHRRSRSGGEARLEPADLLVAAQHVQQVVGGHVERHLGLEPLEPCMATHG